MADDFMKKYDEEYEQIYGTGASGNQDTTNHYDYNYNYNNQQSYDNQGYNQTNQGYSSGKQQQQHYQ